METIAFCRIYDLPCRRLALVYPALITLGLPCDQSASLCIESAIVSDAAAADEDPPPPPPSQSFAADGVPSSGTCLGLQVSPEEREV